MCSHNDDGGLLSDTVASRMSCHTVLLFPEGSDTIGRFGDCYVLCDYFNMSTPPQPSGHSLQSIHATSTICYYTLNKK